MFQIKNNLNFYLFDNNKYYDTIILNPINQIYTYKNYYNLNKLYKKKEKDKILIYNIYKTKFKALLGK